MVEFEIDESFDDWTASFLELTGLDVMDQTQEQGAEESVQREDDIVQSKDDLGGSQDVHDRTGSLAIEEEDPGHSGVTSSGLQRGLHDRSDRCQDDTGVWSGRGICLHMS